MPSRAQHGWNHNGSPFFRIYYRLFVIIMELAFLGSNKASAHLDSRSTQRERCCERCRIADASTGKDGYFQGLCHGWDQHHGMGSPFGNVGMATHLITRCHNAINTYLLRFLGMPCRRNGSKNLHPCILQYFGVHLRAAHRKYYHRDAFR